MSRLPFTGTEQQIRGKLPRCAARNPHSSHLSHLLMMFPESNFARELTTNLQLHMKGCWVREGPCQSQSNNSGVSCTKASNINRSDFDA